MKRHIRGLFDEQYRMDKVSNQRDPLDRLQRHINFELVRQPLEEHLQNRKERRS